MTTLSFIQFSRKRDKRRQLDASGLIPAYSYREIGEILKINKSTVSRYVMRLCEAGKIEPRTKRDAKKIEKISYISKEAAKHAGSTAILPKRPKFVDLGEEVIARETSMYDDDGNLHPAYESEEAGMFGAVTKKIKKELDTFEFMTAMAFNEALLYYTLRHISTILMLTSLYALLIKA